MDQELVITIDKDSPLFQAATLLLDNSKSITALSTKVADMQMQLNDAQAQTQSAVTASAALKTLVDTQSKQIDDLKHQVYVLTTPAWEQDADAIISTATALYNAHMESGQTLYPYVFGGNPKLDADGNVIGGSFDCSALTQYCYKVHGYTLPRTSYNQAKQGTEVALTDIRKGDLIALDVTSSRSTPNGIDHVQIYIGDGKIVHTNPSGNGINIKDLSDFTSKIVTIRRIINK
ncbi:C40 family peptidase [Paenibacillus hexagrammi]|uniref:C40 family peptidase n=1 Tax=Paenibacillus hexagrammi TaxID=2908839 RepID=A0ABY3SUG5_9BACL|nr:C40 family peptidase [Paenibacillus sp. YPD9-1]UJF36616.1 C40 family peptidase [Paenibacillus sp. YPD9-1]